MQIFFICDIINRIGDFDMINKQIFIREDPLKLFKEKVQTRFPNCAFYNHPVNGNVDVATGSLEGVSATEAVITDGTISLQRKNHYSPSIVWKNHFLTLDDGTSVSIEIQNASFMISVTKYLGQSQVDIHVEKEDRDTIQRILNFFYQKQLGLYNTNSITFNSPTILKLESIVDGKQSQELIDFNLGSSQYRKVKKGRRH